MNNSLEWHLIHNNPLDALTLSSFKSMLDMVLSSRDYLQAIPSQQPNYWTVDVLYTIPAAKQTIQTLAITISQVVTRGFRQ